MTRFSIRGIFSRKLRTALTAIAIVLGVAMVCGTYVLTDSISQAFDSIFASTYENTDAVVTGKRAFTGSENGDAVNPSFDESLLPKVKRASRRRRRDRRCARETRISSARTGKRSSSAARRTSASASIQRSRSSTRSPS